MAKHVHIHLGKTRDADIAGATGHYNRLMNELKNLRQRFLMLADEGAKSDQPDSVVFKNALQVAKVLKQSFGSQV